MTTVLRQSSSATPAAVWALWSETGRWPQWDPAVASVAPETALSAGLALRVATVSGTVTRARIVSVNPGRGYVERAKLPLARVAVTRSVAASAGDGSVLTAAVAFTGVLGGAWGLLLSSRVSASVAGTLRAVARAAETPER